MFSSDLNLYRIFGNTWSCHFPKEEDPTALLGGEVAQEEGSQGYPQRISSAYWELQIEADNYHQAQGAARAIIETVYRLGMEAILQKGLLLTMQDDGREKKLRVCPIKASWAEWGLSFIPFFRTMGSSHLRRFKATVEKKESLWSTSLFQVVWLKVLPLSCQNTIEIARKDFPNIEYVPEEDVSRRLSQEPFQDPWTQVASQVFQNHTKYYYPQSAIVSDFRLVLREGKVCALPISEMDDPEENRRSLQAYQEFLLSEYECPIDHNLSLLASIQCEYQFDLKEMYQKGEPLTPEHVYRINIGVNVLSIQRANRFYRRLVVLRDGLKEHEWDREDVTPLKEAIVDLFHDASGKKIWPLSLSELRSLIRMVTLRAGGNKVTLSTLCQFLEFVTNPRGEAIGNLNGALPPNRQSQRVQKFYELLPVEEAKSLPPFVNKEVVASHFNQTLFLRTALRGKVVAGEEYPSHDYPVRRLKMKQFQLLIEMLLPPDAIRSRIYTGKEIRHTPILGYMTVDDPKDGRRVFKPWQNQQDELQIYFDQRSPEHFENWTELACHVTCKTDRTHRYSDDPNALRVGDLIPAPDTWKRERRWYIITAVTDDGIGNFNYCLEPTSRASNLPFVKLYRSTASDLHANNGLASVYTDLVGKAPGAYGREFADVYDDPLFHKRTIPEEVSRWIAAQKIGLLETLKEKYTAAFQLHLSKTESESFWHDLKIGRYRNRIDKDTLEHLINVHHTIACACEGDAIKNIWEKSLNYIPMRLEDESEEILKLRHLSVLTEMFEEMHKACLKMFAEVLKEDAYEEDIRHAASWLHNKFSAHEFVDLKALKLRIEHLEAEFPMQIELVKEDLVFLRQIFHSLAALVKELPQHKIHDDLLFAGHSLGGAQAQGAMWHFLFYKKRLPLPGCYAYCYANDSPKIPAQDNRGFLKRGGVLQPILEKNGNFFFVYHKEDGRGDPVPESGGHHLGSSLLGGKPYSRWLKVVTNVFAEAPTATLPEIVHLSAHAGRTGKAIAKRAHATQRKVEDGPCSVSQ